MMSTIAEVQPQFQPDAGTVCVWVAAIAIVTPIRAVILRAGCSLYNKLVGGKGSPIAVPEPEFGKAINIALSDFLLGGLAGLVIRSIGVAEDLGAIAIGLLLAILTMTVMIAWWLPTTFVRAFLVSLIVYLVGFAIGLGFAAIIVMLFHFKLIRW